MTPKNWYDMTIGKSYDMDNFPWYNKYQCWDYFDYFRYYNKLTKLNTYCSLTGYAGDLWKNRFSNGASNYFEFIAPHNLQSGDWIFYDKHVAFLYVENGVFWEVGQNQIAPRNTVTKMKLNRNGILGGFRYKFWDNSEEKGVADCFSTRYAGNYIVNTTAGVNVRYGGDVKYKSYGVLPDKSKMTCYGYYTKDAKNRIWLYVNTILNGKLITGFVCYDYIRKLYSRQGG